MRRFGDTAIGVVTAVALGSGAWLLGSGTASHGPPQPSASEAGPGRTGTGRTGPGEAGSGETGPAGIGSGKAGSGRTRSGKAGEHAATPEAPAAAALPPSPPRRIRIPAIGVDAPVTGLGLTPSGSLDVPPAEDRNLAGWYAAGVTPGETGTAIVAGHVDNADGPAVFFRLGAVKKGGRVEVVRRDGAVAVFTVDAVEVYAARDFPDGKVYGPAKRPELRIITCGGAYARGTGYRANVVVFAHLTDTRGARTGRGGRG